MIRGSTFKAVSVTANVLKIILPNINTACLDLCPDGNLFLPIFSVQQKEVGKSVQSLFLFLVTLWTLF